MRAFEPRRQRGVALLTALLVVALAAVIAYGLLQSGQRGLHSATAGSRSLQARLVARGLEEFALSALARDLANGGQTDSLSDAWAGTLPPLPFERGFVLTRIQDLDGRFNVNTLLRADGTPDALAQKRFGRLLTQLDLPASVLPALIDWIDSDSLSQPGGAEDVDYLRDDPAWRCPNRPLVDVSELRGLAGLDEAGYRRLAPLVSTLPREHRLNLNTAPVEVLRAIVPELDPDRITQLRPNGGRWQDIDEFRRALATQNLSLPPGEEPGLGFASRWFVATATVELDGAAYPFQALLERAPGVLAVRWRQRGAATLP